MAFSTNGNGGTGPRRRGQMGSLADINVTPFVDVVLVLLIIFMLTAHVMEFGIHVDVPHVRGVKETAEELPVITINKEGEITLNGKPVDINEMSAVIHQRFPRAKGVYVRADKETIFDPIAQTVAELGEGHFAVNLVTQPEDTSKRKR